MLVCTIGLFRLYGVLVLVFATFLRQGLCISLPELSTYIPFWPETHTVPPASAYSALLKRGHYHTQWHYAFKSEVYSICSKSSLLSGDWSTYFHCAHSDTYIQQWTTYDLFPKYFMHRKTIVSVLGWTVVWLREGSILIWAGASGPVASAHA